MCGIAGFIGEDQGRIDRMCTSLVHRGPDGNGTYVGHGVSLGHARLAILDPSSNADQPMWNDERTIVIVFNGEIFNFRRLREIEGLRCETGSDTEVLLKLYEKEGIGFITKLIGMFAFALYDTRSQTLHLVRDPSGIKPLYVHVENGNPHFASEMRCLLSVMSTKPPVNLRSMSAFLRLQYVPGPETMCEGIESLTPGTILSYTNGKQARRTFQTNVGHIEPPKTREAFRQSFPMLMQNVVEDHMIADKPIGLFLSGGMDSSIILHHMAAASKEPVKTFTVRFDATEEEDAARFNRDAELAKQTAHHYKTDHQELLLTAEDYAAAYRDTAKALDLPNSDAVSVAQKSLAKLAKKHVDVVLSGAGGDELFGGYPRFRIAKILGAFGCLPSSLRSLGASLTGYPADVLRLTPGPALAERLLARPIHEIRSIVRGQWFDESVVRDVFCRHFEAAQGDHVRKFMEVDRHLWLVDESLKLADAVTMSCGLECRVPFIDPRVIGLSLATPSEWHVTMRRTKALLKDTYRPLLPSHLFSLQKASFYPPLAKWIRRECAPLIEEALQGKAIQEFFDVSVLRHMFERHRKKEGYELHPLMNVVQLNTWFETVYNA
jgi:asparagine synthase (glutamine-hydrolysing)